MSGQEKAIAEFSRLSDPLTEAVVNEVMRTIKNMPIPQHEKFSLAASCAGSLVLSAAAVFLEQEQRAIAIDQFAGTLSEGLAEVNKPGAVFTRTFPPARPN